jgi:Mn2+/Fe2+ NRAMP family transporter
MGVIAHSRRLVDAASSVTRRKLSMFQWNGSTQTIMTAIVAVAALFALAAITISGHDPGGKHDVIVSTIVGYYFGSHAAATAIYRRKGSNDGH